MSYRGNKVKPSPTRRALQTLMIQPNVPHRPEEIDRIDVPRATKREPFLKTPWATGSKKFPGRLHRYRCILLCECGSIAWDLYRQLTQEKS
jgi:hypothetical protein